MDNPIQNAFSIDVEDYFHVSAFEGVVKRSDWESIESRVERNTGRFLDILSQHEVTATFFVLGWVAERYPGLVRRISDEGHEIGCHGYSHRKIYDQSQKVFIEEVIHAKSILEDCVGRPVVGYRAASFSITTNSLWALDVLAETGFLYDSSIYPVWHDNYGIPGAEKRPSRIQTPAGHTIVEFPLSIFQILGVPLPVGGGGYFRLYPYWLTRWLLKSISDHGRPVNFYCHPWELDAEQPRFEQASWRSRFRHYNNLDRVEGRLSRLLTDFKFGTCREVLQQQGLVQGEHTEDNAK